MSRSKIIRVWGKADSFDIEFVHIKGDIWSCEIPPDTKDGQYAVEIQAVNEYGETAYWTGTLYMCGGVCHLEIIAQPYLFWISARSLELEVSCRSPLCFAPLPRIFAFCWQNYKITIKKGCGHV